MADEIKDPRKTIPFAVVGGIAIAAVIYLIVAGTTLGVLGAEAMGQTDAPIFRSPATALAGWGGWMILMSAWLTALSEMLGDLLSTSKVGHAMGNAKELPHWLGVVQQRFHSPHHALFVLTIIGLALSLPRWSIVGTGGILALLAGIRWLLIHGKMRPA